MSQVAASRPPSACCAPPPSSPLCWRPCARACARARARCKSGEDAHRRRWKWGEKSRGCTWTRRTAFLLPLRRCGCRRRLCASDLSASPRAREMGWRRPTDVWERGRLAPDGSDQMALQVRVARASYPVARGPVGPRLAPSIGPVRRAPTPRCLGTYMRAIAPAIRHLALQGRLPSAAWKWWQGCKQPPNPPVVAQRHMQCAQPPASDMDASRHVYDSLPMQDAS